MSVASPDGFSLPPGCLICLSYMSALHTCPLPYVYALNVCRICLSCVCLICMHVYVLFVCCCMCMSYVRASTFPICVPCLSYMSVMCMSYLYAAVCVCLIWAPHPEVNPLTHTEILTYNRSLLTYNRSLWTYKPHPEVNPLTHTEICIKCRLRDRQRERGRERERGVERERKKAVRRDRQTDSVCVTECARSLLAYNRSLLTDRQCVCD